MARIDVSELMVDPDFIMNFSIVRRVPTVNSYGENTFTETTIATTGSIQPASPEAAKRLPEALQLSRIKTIYTKSVMVADGTARYPDQVIIKSLRYNVVQVTPWEDFGAGWYMVDVELQVASL